MDLPPPSPDDPGRTGPVVWAGSAALPGWPECVRSALPGSVLVLPGTAGSAPRWKGAYALAFTLSGPADFPRRGSTYRLPCGAYVYAGSAYGPGGIGARLRRHFRRGKKRHWHIDHLTAGAVGLMAFAIEGGSECDILARLGGVPGFAHVLDGFGSSDCPDCRSHLLAFSPSLLHRPEGISPESEG